MERLRVGFVGCGRIASEFEERSTVHPVSIAGAFDANGETRIVAAANRGEERLGKFGARWGVSALYGDYREMLRRERLDIVAVATHPPLHPEIVEAACAAGVKGIFCEKPMALDLDGCDRIVAAAAARGVKVVVNCTRRFDGRYESVRRIVERGDLGDLIHMVGHCQGAKPVPEWESETEGPLLHDAVHLLDIMRFYAGDAESLVASALNPTRRFRFEDSSHSVIRFTRGVEGVAIVDERAEYCDFSLELNFTRGRIRMERFCPGLWKSVVNPQGENGWWQSLTAGELPAPAWEGTGMKHAVGNLVDSVLRGAQVRCSDRDGLAAVELIMGIYESELTGGRVAFPLPRGRSPLEALRGKGAL